MVDYTEKLESYLVKYLHHELTPDEYSELKKLLEESDSDRALFVKCLSAYKNSRKLQYLRTHDQNEVWELLCQKRAMMRRLKVRRILSYAAVVLVVLGCGLTALLLSSKPAANDFNQETKPQGKVILTLASGRQIVLGEEQKIIGEDGEVVICDSSTHLSYHKLANDQKKIEYNELSIPRGATYSLTLADGTRVWLNSESYLRFPVPFPADKREVELIGEAYFEVAKEKNRIFSVKVGEQSIEVLGTHFNISAYKDVEHVYTTLVQGSVRVKTVGNEKLLTPGEQASVAWDEQEIKVRKVDVNLYISWHWGVYEFKNISLDEIINYLMRWYDIDISLRNEKLKYKRFTGAFKREDSLEFTIGNLETISGLKFEQVDNKWIVCE